MRFEWDAGKARSNAAKHGITFDEAATVFTDPTGLLMPDPEHSSEAEDRAVLLGYSDRLRLLVVVHVEFSNETIRIISARRATNRESEQYHRRLA
ncbi:MAG: BrnT family toxin [Planctomycetes bacterium]|nr:BrnT family toxin [Planctomycetota bacterium]